MARRNCSFELEIFESGFRHHKIGDKYAYPDDKAKH